MIYPERMNFVICTLTVYFISGTSLAEDVNDVGAVGNAAGNVEHT